MYQSQINITSRDSYLDIVSYLDDEVSISGGYQLPESSWESDGNVKKAIFEGTCSNEAFQGKYRLIPARSPNTDWGFNMNVAKAPYHYITDLLVESSTCKRNSTKYSQNCPQENKYGMIVSDEINENWDYLDQTRVLIFHSWIAEWTEIGSVTTLDNGYKKIMFDPPLQHGTVGQYNKPSGWRFLLFNKYVCFS